MIAKENTAGFIPELQIVEESIYEDAMAIVEPVSYTHLDVYKRQEIEGMIERVLTQNGVMLS